MAVHRRRTHFAAPFIVVLGCGGGHRPEPEAPDVPGAKWTVNRIADECNAHRDEGDCPKGARCNPPPPSPVDCPTGLAESGNVRIVERADATCAIIPAGCTELACVTQTTPCPGEPGAPRKLTGSAWQVTKADDACFARLDTCAATETACAQAIDCPPEAPVRIVQWRDTCHVTAEGCADTSCVKGPASCPAPVGKDLGALRWLGKRQGTTCVVTSTGPIAGELVQTIACPKDPASSSRFQIDRPTRAEPCVYRAGTAPAVETPCPP